VLVIVCSFSSFKKARAAFAFFRNLTGLRLKRQEVLLHSTWSPLRSQFN
jgi:hypothetical protein